MLDGEPDSQNHKQLRDGWMDEIALEGTVCTCKTLITLTPQLRINYALKVLQQTGQPILDILVRKVYMFTYMLGSFTFACSQLNRSSCQRWRQCHHPRWSRTPSAGEEMIDSLGFSDFARCLDIIDACSWIMLLASTS